MKRDKLTRFLAGMLAAVMIVSTGSVNGMNVHAEKTAGAAEARLQALVPKPLECTGGEGEFVLADGATIAVLGETAEETAELERIAHMMEASVEASTGYDIFVEEGTEGEIALTTAGADEALGGQGYRLETTADQVTVTAPETEGVYNGVQTLRQLFPADMEKEEVVTGVEWSASACTIKDKPEYEYRGLMLDSVRHFLSVDQVKRQIEFASQYKINRLHLRLADDQGWRLEIKGEMYGESLDKLRTIGASTSCTSNGVSAGQYTQEEFKDLVKFAQEHYVEIIPEFDMPGHSWAAMVSLEFLNSTEDGKPHSGGYNNTKPYEGWDVGFSTMECRNEKTYEFIEEVIKQTAAISASRYIHIGGDEAHATSWDDYAYFMDRVTEIVHKYGKTPYGWQNYDRVIAEQGKENAVSQFWSTGNAQLKAGVNYVVSAADHAYLDMKYDSGCPYGLQWATMNPVDDAYQWDPTDHGLKEQILGIEAPLFGETIRTNEALDYMIYPRLPGHAEIGWVAKDERSWDEYKTRIAAHEERFEAQGIRYRRDEIIWPKEYVPVNMILPFEEGTGTATTDMENRYTAQFSPSGVTWTDGKFGKAVHFDGTGFIDIRADDLKGDWTIGMWVKREDINSSNEVLISGNQGELKLEQWNNTNKVGVTKFGVEDAQFNYSAPVNEWVHLAFAGDSAGTTLYVNGVEQGHSAVVIEGPVYRLGANKKEGLESTGNMKGSLDNVEISNRRLSADEIKHMMEDPTDFTEIEWKMNEGEGSVITDTTGSFSAELGNGVTWADGKNGKALHFNGTGYVDLGLADIAGDWTIGMWIKREASPYDNAVLLAGRDGNNLKLDQWKNTGKVGFSKSGVDDWTFEYSVPTDVWTHLTFKKDSTGITLYVNGTETAHNNSSIAGPLFRLGANTGEGLKDLGNMKAAVDDLHIFKKALTEDEIAVLAVDKAQLQELADACKDYNGESTYLDEFQAERDKAAALLAEDAATQEQIDAQFAALDKFYDLARLSEKIQKYKPENKNFDYTSVRSDSLGELMAAYWEGSNVTAVAPAEKIKTCRIHMEAAEKTLVFVDADAKGIMRGLYKDAAPTKGTGAFTIMETPIINAAGEQKILLHAEFHNNGVHPFTGAAKAPFTDRELNPALKKLRVSMYYDEYSGAGGIKTVTSDVEMLDDSTAYEDGFQMNIEVNPGTYSFQVSVSGNSNALGYTQGTFYTSELPEAEGRDYVIKVVGGTMKDTGLTEDTYAYNASVTVTADDKENFRGWSVNGEIVSTDAEYKFYASAAMTVTAVYEEKEMTAEALMTNVIAAKRADGKYDVKFVAQLVVPEGCSVKNAGLVWSAKDEAVLELGGADAKTTYIAKISNTNQFSVTIKGMPEGRFVRGKIFATLEKAAEEQAPIYSSEKRVVTPKAAE